MSGKAPRREYRRQKWNTLIAQGASRLRSRKSVSREISTMETMCCCSSMSFSLLQDFRSSMSPQQSRIMSRCSSSFLSPRRLRGEQFKSSNVTFVGYCQRKWKLELRSRGLNYTNKNLFHIPGWACPSDGESETICCGVKYSCGGDLEEPLGNTTEKEISKDGKYCSSLDSSFKCGEVPIISSREETTSNPSVVSPVRPSASISNSSTSRVGVQITTGHFLLAGGALLLADYHILMTNPQSAVPLGLSSPFFLSAAVTASLGYFFVPVLEYFKAAQVFRIEGPTSHNNKIGTPTMGGLFFVPVGVAMGGLFTGFKSIEVQAAMISTLALAAIGMMDDVLALWRRHNYGLPGRVKLTMQVAVGISHFCWLEFTRLSYPHSIKYRVWLPAPFGTVHLAKWYLPLTAFCFAAMSNGVNLTDGLDGLAAGSAAVTFIAMSIAMLPFLPALGVFGSSMAGACFGFLLHNRYKAKVFMGDTGSLALGGALAAMACCTGMFFPLFIASGVFVIETVSVISQVLYFKLTKQMYGEGRRLFLMSPLHHHLELLGWKEPIIVIMAYGLSIALGALAVYLVLGNGITVSIN